jgi:4a-hydroxytetrahydrobiopterin dehydratase
MSRLTGEALRQRAAGIPDWKTVDEQHLAKTFVFPDFVTALNFVNRVGAAAEEQGHHPDLYLAWGRVDVKICTHSAGGVTEADFLLAEKTDRAFFAR